MTKENIDNLRELVNNLHERIIPELIREHQIDRDEKAEAAYKAEELYNDSLVETAELYDNYCTADDAARQADWILTYLEDFQYFVKKAAEAVDDIEETVTNPRNLSRRY